MYEWDKGLDYKKTYRQILNHLKNSNRATQRAYDIILLTQLRNGSRIGEAIAFLKQVLESRKREGYVKVEKRGDGYERLMVLPEEIKITDVLSVGYVIEKATVEKLSVYCRYTYGFNTHALRYAYISYLARKGTSPQLIAKLTGHKALDFILYYTQQVQAEEILREGK